MSASRFRVVWFDDDLGRLETLKRQLTPQLRRLGMTFETLPFDESFKEIDPVLRKLRGLAPDLLVIDHFLDNREHPSLPKTGSAWSILIREKSPQIALIGVSAAETSSAFTSLAD